MWLSDLFPQALMAPGPRGLLWAQWLELPLLVVVSWLVGYVLGRLCTALLMTVARRTSVSWDDPLVGKLRAPFTLGWAMTAAFGLRPLLGLPESAELFTDRLLRTGLFVAIFWVLMRAVRAMGDNIVSSPWATSHPTSRSLVPLGVRIARLVVMGLALVAIMAELGFQVTTLVAGLGIGGLALALAGQKTVENLFGAFAIGLDQPFRVGDTIRVDTIEGVVEAIGLRSTRIRTADRTLVTLPNGKLSDMRIESLSARDRMRVGGTLTLVYGTTGEQARGVLARVTQLLRDNPKVWPETILVQLRELGESGLVIEVTAWLTTTDGVEFTALRQEIWLQILDAVVASGAQLAYPTRTVHVQGGALPSA